jgi:L-galactose dehydrogenase
VSILLAFDKRQIALRGRHLPYWIHPHPQEKGVALVNASPFSMGLLTQSGPPAWHPASAEVQRLCKEAVAQCATDGSADPSGIAIKFALRNPGIPTTLVGMCTREQVRDETVPQW